MRKRTLPRHVDSRYKILFIPLLKAIFIIPLELFIFGIFFYLGTLYSFDLIFISFLIIFPIHMFFMELKNKESGFDTIRDYIKLQIQGELPYERSSEYVAENQRYIINRIKRK
ncbi:MAG: hypothetical protein AB7V16_11365 [Vulcanibacillus sp.]